MAAHCTIATFYGTISEPQFAHFVSGGCTSMEERLSQARRSEIIAQFGSRAILVVGDLMVDEYLYGSARRISQEGPVMVVEVVSDEFKPGGAANAGNNLRALGAHVAMAGVVGDDHIGRVLR